MTIAMPTLTRRNGDWFSRKAIPTDIREAYRTAYGVSQEARFRRAGDLPTGEAKKAYGEWLAEVEGRIAALRALRSGTPTPLSQRELHDLASNWYLWFVSEHEDEPGDEEAWDHLFDQYQDVRESAGGIGRPDEVDEEIGRAHQRRIRAKLVELSRLPSFLAVEGRVLSLEATNRLLDEVLPSEFEAALALLRRRAGGDYSVDQRPQRNASAEKLRTSKGVKLAGWTVWDAFTAWVKERKPAAQTLNRWHGVFEHLHKFANERDVALITEEDAVAWKDALVAAGNAQGRTINEVWLTAARTLFAFVVAQKRLTNNPFTGVKVATGKKVPT